MLEEFMEALNTENLIDELAAAQRRKGWGNNLPPEIRNLDGLLRGAITGHLDFELGHLGYQFEGSELVEVHPASPLAVRRCQ